MRGFLYLYLYYVEESSLWRPSRGPETHGSSTLGRIDETMAPFMSMWCDMMISAVCMQRNKREETTKKVRTGACPMVNREEINRPYLIITT